MDTRDKLQSRLEAIKTELSQLEGRMRLFASEARELEIALRVIDRFTDEAAEATTNANQVAANVLGGLNSFAASDTNFTDAIYEAVKEAGASGATSNEIKEYIKNRYDAEVKDSTLSVIIQRHKNKERVLRVGKKWFLPPLAPVMVDRTVGTPVRSTPGSINDLL